MTRVLYRLGRAAVRRRRLVVLGWIVIAVGIIAIGRASGGATSDSFEIPGVEAQRARDTLAQRFPAVAGTSARRARTSGTGASRWARAVAIGFPASKGGPPASISNSRTPVE